MKALLTVALAVVAVTGAAFAEEKPKTAGEVYSSFDIGMLKGAALQDMDPTVLATFDGKVITSEYLEKKIADVPEKRKKQIRPFLLAQFIQREIFLREAKKQGLVEAEGDEQENKAIRNMIVKQLNKVEVSDKEVDEAYEQHKARFAEADPKEVKAFIKERLLQGKRQEAFREFTRLLSKDVEVAVNKAWAEKQHRLATDNPVDKARESGKVTVVEFGAKWCAPCRRLEPILDELQKERKDLNVVRIDVDENEGLATRYNAIRALPTILFFDATGKAVARFEGALSKEKIIEQLDKASGDQN